MDITEDEKIQFEALIKKHEHVFSKTKNDLGLCNFYKAKIDLKKDFNTKWVPSHQVNYKLRDEMDNHIQHLLDEGAIEECEHSLWNSPVFLVKKPGGGTRFVADMRKLNEECLLDNFELPNINKLLDEIGDARYFTTLDITSSFNQVEYEEDSRPMTAFFYNNKQYMYKRLVQGQKSSPAKFSRMIAKLFCKVPFKNLIVFIDDFLIPGKDFVEHLAHIDYVLEKLGEAGLKLNPEKSKFLRSEVKFVGHNISAKGMQMDKDRLDPILKINPPRTIKQTQSLLGVLNYNRGYCRDFSATVKPIYELLQKDKKFEWTKECQQALDTIKKSLTETPTLSFTDLERDDSIFELHTDSSQQGFGAVLYQTIQGAKKIISYFSKATPRHRKKLGATKLEFLGLYYALIHWKHLLLGRFFKVYTDCLPLVNLDNLFVKGDMLMQRKIEQLAPFNMKITHVSGTSNTFADFLSRYPFKTTHKNIAVQTENIPHFANDHQVKKLSPAPKNYNIPQIISEVTENEHVVYDDHIKEKKIDLISRKEIIMAQKQDPILMEVIPWVKKGSKPSHIQENMRPKELLSLYRQFKMLKYEKDLLLRKWTSHTNPDDHVWLIVVPFNLQLKIMASYHDNISLCHPGTDACLDKCRRRFYWSHMKDDFAAYVGSCIKCVQNKQCKRFLKAPMSPLIFNKFNAAVGIDHIILNNGRPTDRGHTCILSITDMFTNYCVLVNCKGQTSEETIGHLIKEWILKFGLFDQIIHDLHAGFTSKLFTKILETFQIKNTKTTPYRCLTNGRAEATNKRAGAALRAAIPREDIHNWDIYTMHVSAALNSLKSSHTGFTPNFLVFGRELMYPIEWFLNLESLGEYHDPRNLPTDIQNPQELYANKLYLRMKRVNHKGQQVIKQQAEYMKRIYDRRLAGPYFEAGQYVLMIVEPEKTKLAPRWRGPYYVKDKISDHLYVIEINKAKSVYKIVNIEKLKLFKPSEHTPIIVPEASFPYEPTTHKQKISSRARHDSEDSDYGIDLLIETVITPIRASASDHAGGAIPVPIRVTGSNHVGGAIPAPIRATGSDNAGVTIPAPIRAT